MIECFLPWQKSVGLTKSTWDYWTAKVLRNEIWRPSPLGHLWHEVIIIYQLFSGLCEMNVVLCSLWKHVHHTTAASWKGVHWHIYKDGRSTKVFCSVEAEPAPLIHCRFSCARFQLFLEDDLDDKIISAVFPPQLHTSMTKIKNTKKTVIGTTSLAEEGPIEQCFQFRPLVWLTQLPVLSQCSGNNTIKNITVEISFYWYASSSSHQWTEDFLSKIKLSLPLYWTAPDGPIVCELV